MPHTASRYLAEGPRVGVRHFSYEDGAEFTARARESKDLHQPWLFPPASGDAYTAYARRLIQDPAKAGSPVSPGTLLWGGAYGSTWWIDRQAKLSVVLLTNTAFEGLAGQVVKDVQRAVYGR